MTDKSIEESEKSQNKGFLENFDFKVFIREGLKTGIMLAMLYLAFNVGQLQTWNTISYYNQICAIDYLPNGQLDYPDFFNIGDKNATIPIENPNFETRGIIP